MGRNLNKGLIVVGLLLMGVFAVWRLTAGQDVSFALPEAVGAVEQAGTVELSKLVIPSLQIDLGIEESGMVEGKWQVSSAGVSHWNQSAVPGAGENIVVYGHNWSNRLGKLKQIEMGAAMKLVDATGQEYEYVVEEIVVVNPDQVAYILPVGSEQLTVYTCTGWLDRQRLVVVAKAV